MIFWVNFTLTSGLIFTCLEHIAFFTNNLTQMCLMLDHFLVGGIHHVNVSSCDSSYFALP